MAKHLPFIHPAWRTSLISQQLTSVTAWWALAHDASRSDMMDDDNIRYGGISNVHRTQITDGQGNQHDVYIKCQIDQFHRSWEHPFKGLPTLMTELHALQTCAFRGIPTASPLFCDTQKTASGKTHTVLVSLGLEGYQCLDDWQRQPINVAQKKQLINDIADTIAWLHQQGYVHRNLYGNHIFASWRPHLGRFETRFIDMEKAHNLYRKKHWLRDLDTICRRTQQLSDTQKSQLVERYLQQRNLQHLANELEKKLNITLSPTLRP